MTIRLLDERDLPWVSDALDVVAAVAGKPWRVALERLDDTRRIEQPHAPVRYAAVVGAMQRILGGRARNAVIARTARALALGAPALSAAEREARIAYAAQELEITCAAVETLLWSDLPRERPVELPRGRPSEFEVAALANVQLLQRAVRRAQSLTLRVWGDAGPLVRAAARRGLLTTLSVRADADRDARVTVLDIVGPLALFHRTAVYGRALADLVPLLADCERFELELTARGREQFYTIEVASPVLLPAIPARLTVPGFDLQRLIKALEREARSATAAGPAVTITPHVAAIRSGNALVCPDVLIERGERRVYVEIVGFWTIEFLQRKLALYRAAGIADVVLCIDDSRGCSDDELPDDMPVLRYAKRMTMLASRLMLRVVPADVFAGRAL